MTTKYLLHVGLGLLAPALIMPEPYDSLEGVGGIATSAIYFTRLPICQSVTNRVRVRFAAA